MAYEWSWQRLVARVCVLFFFLAAIEHAAAAEHYLSFGSSTTGCEVSNNGRTLTVRPTAKADKWDAVCPLPDDVLSKLLPAKDSLDGYTLEFDIDFTGECKIGSSGNYGRHGGFIIGDKTKSVTRRYYANFDWIGRLADSGIRIFGAGASKPTLIGHEETKPACQTGYPRCLPKHWHFAFVSSKDLTFNAGPVSYQTPMSKVFPRAGDRDHPRLGFWIYRYKASSDYSMRISNLRLASAGSATCQPGVCQNGGTCFLDSAGNVRCKCTDGYTGDRCQNDRCNTCLNGGICDYIQGIYMCMCKDGFTGDHCEKDWCNTCLNGGVCEYIQGNYKCTCKPGFKGDRCEFVTNPCQPNPCLNGGTCSQSGSGSYICKCESYYVGDHCEKEFNACDSNPCLNGGTCHRSGCDLTEYFCDCKAGFEGDRCESQTNPCQPDPCLNGGTCYFNEHGFYCDCQLGFKGIHCEHGGTSNACQPNPCKNGGTCHLHGPSFVCQCKPGFSGDECATVEGGSLSFTGAATTGCEVSNDGKTLTVRPTAPQEVKVPWNRVCSLPANLLSNLGLPATESLSGYKLEFDVAFTGHCKIGSKGNYGRHGGFLIGDKNKAVSHKYYASFDWIDRYQDNGLRIHKPGKQLTIIGHKDGEGGDGFYPYEMPPKWSISFPTNGQCRVAAGPWPSMQYATSVSKMFPQASDRATPRLGFWIYSYKASDDFAMQISNLKLVSI